MIFPQVVYLIKFGSWMLTLMELLPMSLLVSLSLVRYLQAV
jgi:hypothetical protein